MRQHCGLEGPTIVRFVLIAFALAVAACATEPRAQSASQKAAGDVARLKRYLTGTFASTDPRTGIPIKIIIEPFETHNHAPKDGSWMLFSMLPSPATGWMQAFYRLNTNQQGETVIESWRIWKETVYTPQANRFTVEDAASYHMASAVYTVGCDVVLNVNTSGRYEGGHAPRGACKNTRRGASYVWAQKWFEADAFMFLENGYDANGNAVWGPGNTGFVFRRTH